MVRTSLRSRPNAVRGGVRVSLGMQRADLLGTNGVVSEQPERGERKPWYPGPFRQGGVCRRSSETSLVRLSSSVTSLGLTSNRR